MRAAKMAKCQRFVDVTCAMARWPTTSSVSSSYDSGYNARILRERVSARSIPQDSTYPPQAGVFIYTAAGDAEGTLGGLVRQGRPPYLGERL
ncbi:hypothetical protein GCM10020229_36450 [Kitasatospora albolonga]